MKLPVISENRSLNFLCWFTYFYAIIFFGLGLLCEIKSIEFIVEILYLPLIIFGGVALIAPYLFISLLILPILLEYVLMKNGYCQKLTLSVNKTVGNLLICLAITIIIGLYNFGYSALFSDSARNYDEIKDYHKAINKIENQEKIRHFPKSIPENSEEAQLWAYIGGLKGEFILLKFKTDKEFIQKELKKHKFLNADTPVGTKQKIYYMYSDNGRITSDGYTFYVLDRTENHSPDSQYFPYYNGIAVDKDMTHILYYNIVPGD